MVNYDNDNIVTVDDSNNNVVDEDDDAAANDSDGDSDDFDDTGKWDNLEEVKICSMMKR